MAYQIKDTTAGIDQAMRLIKPSMKGMPGRSAYMKEYDAMRQKVAMLMLTIADGEAQFDPDASVRKAQKAANELLKPT